jgi:hypothetical protein
MTAIVGNIEAVMPIAMTTNNSRSRPIIRPIRNAA